MPRKYKKSSQKFNKKVQNVVRRMAETKIIDYPMSEQLIVSNDTAPYLQDMTQIARGGSADQRIGNEILMSGVKYRLLFHNRNNSQITSQTVIKSVWVRIAIIMQNNVDNTTVLDGFFRRGSNNVTFDLTTEAEKYYLPIDQTNRKTLFQKTFKLGQKNASYTNDYVSNKIEKLYRKINKQINFEENNVSNSASNRIYFVCWCGNNDLDASAENQAGALEMSGLLSTYYKDF